MLGTEMHESESAPEMIYENFKTSLGSLMPYLCAVE